MASWAARPWRSARRTGASRPSPSPVTILGSATPGSPSGVAKTTRWPASVSTRQGTPVSVGSKSRLGSGVSTVAMASTCLGWRRLPPGERRRPFLHEVSDALLEVRADEAGGHVGVGGVDGFAQALEQGVPDLALHLPLRARRDLAGQ